MADQDKIYIHLFHGRKTSDEELDDWGEVGPTFGPYESIQVTYKFHIKMHGPIDSFHDLYWGDDDLIYYDGMRYGDACILTNIVGLTIDKYDSKLTKEGDIPK